MPGRLRTALEESAGQLPGHRHCRGWGGSDIPSKTSTDTPVHQLPDQKQLARPPASCGCRLGSTLCMAPVEGGHRVGHQRDIPRVLQPTVSGSQEDGRSPSGDRSFHSQPPYGSSTLQDGDTGIRPCGHQKSRVDSVHRYPRRLSTCPDAPSRPEVSVLCGQLESLPIHLSTLRIGNVTSRVHQALATSRSAVKAAKCVKLHVYLDDWLICADTPEQMQLHAQTTIRVLQFLGWIINYEKSDLVPSQDSQFIGMQFNTRQFTAAPLPKMRLKVQSFHQHWMTNPNITARDLHRLLGVLVFMASLVQRSVFVRSSGGPPQHGARGPGARPTGSHFLSGCRQTWPGGHLQQSCKVLPSPPRRRK